MEEFLRALSKNAEHTHVILPAIGEQALILRPKGGPNDYRRYDMTTLTVRLPDEKHRRLKALAKSCGTPQNRLIDDMTTVMLAEFDAETRFQLRAARGTGQEALGLQLLDKALQP